MGPSDTLGTLPHPGVLVAIYSTTLPIPVSLMVIKKWIKDFKIDIFPEDDSDFIIYRYHTFISYSNSDKGLANEISDSLQNVGAANFLAERSINLGKDFTSAIRIGMQESRIGLILLTPNSINSNWVLAEAGALWALDKKIIPAYLNINLDDLPDLIKKNQAIDITTNENREKLVDEIKNICEL